jgi:glucose-1-phosphate thymidylyltransferase
MIYYPLAALKEMGCEEVMVIVGGRSVGDILELLHDGSDIGLSLTYRYQRGALGIAHAIGLTREFVGDSPCAVVLGDNVLQGSLQRFAEDFVASNYQAGAVLKAVADPQRFGVAEFDKTGALVRFEEKPQQPKSDLIPIGVYLFKPSVFDVIGSLQPSPRGEFEITDVLNHYLSGGRLLHTVFEGEWHDAGTIESLLAANTFASTFAPELTTVRPHPTSEGAIGDE